MIVLCDLDNCLALNSHRAYLAQAGEWDEYTENCDKDQCNLALREILCGLATTCRIHIVSGRTESAREKTVSWLFHYGIPFNALLMRPDGDFRPNAALKEMFLMDLCTERGRLVAPNLIRVVFEDDPNSVAMYRRWGLEVIQIDPEHVLHREAG